MKKLSKIDESVWGGILDRGTGEVERKEDKILLGFGVGEMYDYLKDTYKDKVYWMDGDKKSCIEDKTIGIDPVDGISVFFEYGDDDKLERIGMFYTIRSFSREPKEYPEFFKKLSDAFNVSVLMNKPEFSKQWSIKPKYGELTNKTIIEVLNFFLNTEINESIWGGILDRGAGNSLRKEDDISHLDRDGLYNYIYDVFVQTSEFPQPLKGQTNPGHEYFAIGLFKSKDTSKIYRLHVNFEGELIDNIFINASLACCEEFKDVLLEKFNVIEDNFKGLIIQDKDGMTTNQLCIDLIQTIIENTSKPLLKKRGE